MKPARKKPFERKVEARVKQSVARSHWLRAQQSMPTRTLNYAYEENENLTDHGRRDR